MPPRNHSRGVRRSPDTAPDADLVAAMHAPGSEALRILFDRYTRLVHRIAVHILRDEGEAEDVTQEVFFEVYRKAHLYDRSRGPFRGWLLQYAYHRSLRRKDALRRRAAYGAEPLEHVPPSALAHGRELTRQECRWVLRRAFAQLPERQRRCVELACLEDLSLRDVADRLRVSLGCARHYYYRGLTRLRAWARSAAAAATDPEGSTKTSDRTPGRHRNTPCPRRSGPARPRARRRPAARG